MKTLFLSLLFASAALAQLSPITVPNAARLTTITPTPGRPVLVEGGLVQGDGRGTGGWYIVTNISGTNIFAPAWIAQTGGLLTGALSLAQLQDLNWYPLARRQAGQIARLTTGAEYTLGSDLTSWYNSGSVSNMAQLRTIEPGAPGGVISKDGYYVAGDGGGGVYTLTNSIVATNLLGGRVVALGGTMSWNLNVAADGVNPKQFGARGDGLTDDTASVQNAINWISVDSLTSFNAFALKFPVGSFVLDSIKQTNNAMGISWRGEHEKSSGKLPIRFGSRLMHKVGATGDMIYVTSNEGGQPATPLFEGFDFFGHREQNQRNPLTISAVTDRVTFTVPTNGLPAAPSSPTTYPYYGYCFFFSNESRYVGSGLVTNINYTTGQISLVPNTDLYATPTGTTNLPPGYTVCFSPTVTEAASFKTTTGVDPASAGWSAINFAATDGSTIQAEMVIRDCRFRFFHTGIRFGNVLAPLVDNVWMNCNTFAAVASAFPGDQRDGLYQHCFFQGFYSTDPGLAAETNTYDQSLYRRTLFGMYGPSSSGNITDQSFDHFVHGMLLKDGQETKFGTLHIDNPASHAIIMAGGYAYTGRIQNDILSLIVRNGNDGGPGLYDSYVFHALGANNQFQLHGLSVVDFGTERDFQAIFNFPSGTIAAANVVNFFIANGATNRTLYSPATAVYPNILNYWENENRIVRKMGGGDVFLTTATAFKTLQNIVVGETNKTTIPASGFVGLDSAGVYFVLGADSTTGNTRSNKVQKTVYFRLYNYTNASPGATLIGGFSQSSDNTINIGGGDSSGEPATTLNFFTGPKATGAGTKRFEVTSGGTVNVLAGNLAITQAGSGIQIQDGTDAKFQTAVLVAGTVTVTNTSWTAASAVFPTLITAGGTPGALYVSSAPSATVRTITSTSGTDASTIALVAIDPAP